MEIQKSLRQKERSFITDTIDGIECTISYTKKFRIRWAATQLNTFLIVGETSELIDRKRIERFSNEAFSYAIANSKGWPRGFQSSIASIAILKGQVDITAIAYCEKLTKKRFAAFEIPVIYDLEINKGTRFKNSPVWGGLYFPHFSKTIDDLFQELNN